MKHISQAQAAREVELAMQIEWRATSMLTNREYWGYFRDDIGSLPVVLVAHLNYAAHPEKWCAEWRCGSPSAAWVRPTTSLASRELAQAAAIRGYANAHAGAP